MRSKNQSFSRSKAEGQKLNRQQASKRSARALDQHEKIKEGVRNKVGKSGDTDFFGKVGIRRGIYAVIVHEKILIKSRRITDTLR